MTRVRHRRPSNDEGDAWLASFVRRKAVEVDKLPPATPSESDVGKPPRLVAAEADLFRCEIATRLVKLRCRGVSQCPDRPCRRAKRCRELDEMRPLMEEVRAEVARQRAKWRPAAANKKGTSKRAQSVTGK